MKTNISLEKETKDLSTEETTFVGLNGEITGLGFAIRDYGAKSEEDLGIIEFVIIKNDRTHKNMKLLIDLKNILARQLPKMPKDYIVKLVFDRNHEAMIILKNKCKVVGGICYRVYPTQKFAEIAFLAVTATEQVKGYGTRLMNKYKQKMQEFGVEYLLTYADNFALGYFRKQGFSKEVSMPQERWKGFIKDYDGGTFMECHIHPKMDYANISTIIKRQKDFLIEEIKKLSINHIKFDGQALNNLKESAKPRKEEPFDTLIPIQDIQGISVSGWTIEDYYELKKAKERSFNLQCQNIIDMLRRQKNSWPFLEPVNKDDVPDYYEIIKNPIDLKTIEKRLQSNFYHDKGIFIKDILLIFDNARLYNQPETIYHKAANELESFIRPYLDKLKDDKDKENINNEQIDQEYDYDENDNISPKKNLGIKKKIKKLK